jgi:hypothetical protein
MTTNCLYWRLIHAARLPIEQRAPLPVDQVHQFDQPLKLKGRARSQAL